MSTGAVKKAVTLRSGIQELSPGRGLPVGSHQHADDKWRPDGIPKALSGGDKEKAPDLNPGAPQRLEVR